MKKILVIHICLLFCVISCIIKQYHDEYKDEIIVSHHNFPYPKPLFIDTTNCLLLENEQVIAKSCDTTQLRRLSIKAEIELSKKINEIAYELAVRKGKVIRLDTVPTN
jgi:hypothetical protein